MATHWHITCPYCGAKIAQGTGSGKIISDIWLPFIRCEICGKLIATGESEYLTIPVAERVQMKMTLDDIEYIKQSLDRTNNKEYISFLQKNGFIIYPVTNEDKSRFKDVPFEMYINCQPSIAANQSLYSAGVLIDEEKLDKETGGFKQEIAERNAREYNLNLKIMKWTSGIGLVAGFLLASAFYDIVPGSYLWLLGFVLGFGGSLAAGWGLSIYLNNKERKQEKSDKSKTQSNDKSEDK